MKILSPEEIWEILDRVYSAVIPFGVRYASHRIAEAQHKDTLRQVRELLDGIVNPYNTDVHLDAGVYNGLYRNKFYEAIQEIKALLEE